MTVCWDYPWDLKIVTDFHCTSTVFGLWIGQHSVFSESPGADRAGSLVEIALPWFLLFWSTGKGLCLSQPTTPFNHPLLPWLAWSVYSDSFSPGQLHFCLPCPNGHTVTFLACTLSAGVILDPDRFSELCDHSYKCVSTDTFFIICLSTTTMNLKWNNQDVF